MVLRESSILPHMRVVRDRMFPRRGKAGDNGWYRFAHDITWASRTSLINHLIAVYGYKRYLEIGVRNRRHNLDRVHIDEIIGVDPDPASKADFQMTSDEYFKLRDLPQFDIVFIDGMHHADYVSRDIKNTLRLLAPNGTIILHDLNPPTAEHATEIPDDDSRLVSQEWNGTCWKAFAEFRATDQDLEMYTVDTDWGCGVIRRGSQELYDGPWDTYEDLAANRKRLLNLVSVREFLRRHPA